MAAPSAGAAGEGLVEPNPWSACVIAAEDGVVGRGLASAASATLMPKVEALVARVRSLAALRPT